MALTDKLSAIGEAIRAKTGKSDKLTLDQMPGEIASISGGGGSSADVRYVTFMNGDTVLYKKPVAVGDDCVDVVAKGLVSTPTKESTAQYNYTYYGWGATDNGAADANILKNITEDKTVYAIYTATARMYTITYYDSDGTTVLKTAQVAYGATPSYSPTKADHMFMGWTPAVSTVTGNAYYTAQWKELESEPFGDNCRWSLEAGVLIITGDGDMPSYTSATYTQRPWQNQVDFITSVVIEDGVTNIGDRVFYKMSAITGVEIADSVTSIGASAFYNCSALTSLTIPDSVTSIGTSAFQNCSALTSLTIPDSVTSIGGSAFNNSGITSLTIPDSVTSLGSFMSNTSLKSIVIGNGVTTIPSNGFQGCTALESIVIGNGVTTLPPNMISNCKVLTSLTIPDSVTSLSSYALCGSGITSITIPDSVTSIGVHAFSSCDALSSVTFEDTTGWYVSTSSTATSGTNLTLTNPATNATYLTNTYKQYCWFNT